MELRENARHVEIVWYSFAQKGLDIPHFSSNCGILTSNYVLIQQLKQTVWYSFLLFQGCLYMEGQIWS